MPVQRLTNLIGRYWKWTQEVEASLVKPLMAAAEKIAGRAPRGKIETPRDFFAFILFLAGMALGQLLTFIFLLPLLLPVLILIDTFFHLLKE